VIDNAHIAGGDVIVGLASMVQASYETRYNGGMGSNGLTSARHDVMSHYLATKFPESYDAAVPDELVYSGTMRLLDPVPGTPLNAGQLVLSPTRTYAPVIRRLLSVMRPGIHGIVHCTGGAQTKVMHFVSNKHVVKDNLFPTPPLFSLIQQQSGTAWREMYEVFNMGHRMEIYVKPADAQAVIDVAQEFGIEARIVGHVEEAPANRLTIATQHGTFEY
ncbi:MAG: phosphoribosylformylglycinamidine cyclo-ligase, partial [Muribaculaceae bacterium]|nr:phosphoribosylformylglycinamidine cyclo-ligase [Muribaculaceae bacterium]